MRIQPKSSAFCNNMLRAQRCDLTTPSEVIPARSSLGAVRSRCAVRDSRARVVSACYGGVLGSSSGSEMGSPSWLSAGASTGVLARRSNSNGESSCIQKRRRSDRASARMRGRGVGGADAHRNGASSSLQSKDMARSRTSRRWAHPTTTSCVHCPSCATTRSRPRGLRRPAPRCARVPWCGRCPG